ncbi:LysR family transcriptional regulator, partial [Streptomyces sp. ERV7]|uniref:LysR family transcriptional regulator n=1 Tax=Streptomyces sp. ERV7 TaxID=1322334 RepID=UPI000AD195C4
MSKKDHGVRGEPGEPGGTSSARPHDWDVKKLHILRTLRDRGTVTATAEALLMTPSAVSQQLTNLAKQLGVTLLEADGRRVRLTDAAHLVLRHAEAVFAQLERADAELAGYLRGEAGRV